jgi:peptidoglycan/xylan/chitin deacetylase (PgdA/CDA1 family)
VRVRTKVALDAAIRWSPAQLAFHWRASRRLAVLAYHGVDDPERFEDHLEHIRRKASCVSIDEALEAFEGHRSLPPRAVLITFDDGNRSIIDFGMPLLRERGLPAVAFVISGLIGSDRPFWWDEAFDCATRGGVVSTMPSRSPEALLRTLKELPDEERRAAIGELRRSAAGPAARTLQLSSEELRTLESAGIAIGNHTWSHPFLSRCSDQVVRREIEESHRVLVDILGYAPASFAYPYGDRDARAARHLRELGYRAAFLFDHRLSAAPPLDPFAVSRVRVNSWTPLDRFHTITSGLHPAIHRVRRGA